MKLGSFRGILFDLDGTLIDSLSAIDRAWHQWGWRERVDLPARDLLHGRTAADIVSSLVPAPRITASLALLSEIETEDTEGVTPRPGAQQFLEALPEGSWAVVTSATRAVAQARAGAAGLALNRATLITGDDVEVGKPHPEPFLTGARLLGVRASECLALEDSASGLRSALAAGCRCVNVGSAQTPEASGIVSAALETLRVEVAASGTITVCIQRSAAQNCHGL